MKFMKIFLSILVSEHIFENSFLKHDKVPSIHSDANLRGQISGISCLLFTKQAKFFLHTWIWFPYHFIPKNDHDGSFILAMVF